MLAASSHDRNNDPESNHITVSIDVHTAFLHADVDQDLFAEPPEPDEWCYAGLKEDEVWRLNKALSCFRNDETKTNIFIHVDDGLLFGPRSEVLNLVELL